MAKKKILQCNVFGSITEIAPMGETQKEIKRNWENLFIIWRDSRPIADKNHHGHCGHGKMCGYCKNKNHKRACIMALNALKREEHIEIDYENLSFIDAWEGNYGKVY